MPVIFVVYGNSECDFTHKVISAMINKRTNFKFFPLQFDMLPAKIKYLQRKYKGCTNFANLTSHTTMPIIFNGDIFIGGSQEYFTQYPYNPPTIPVKLTRTQKYAFRKFKKNSPIQYQIIRG